MNNLAVSNKYRIAHEYSTERDMTLMTSTGSQKTTWEGKPKEEADMLVVFA